MIHSALKKFRSQLASARAQRDLEREIDRVTPYTFCSRDKLHSLITRCNHLNRHRIAGDFVECGTYKGGSAAIIAPRLLEDRKLWLYDSFEGMPESSDKDGTAARQFVGEGKACVEEVRQLVRRSGAPEDRLVIRKGWFQETFSEPLPEKVALLHCDADWYESVMLVLETFYPLVSDGGIIILDDFGYWEGCREAFYDYCHRHNLKPLVERISSDQLFWYKNKQSNR